MFASGIFRLNLKMYTRTVNSDEKEKIFVNVIETNTRWKHLVRETNPRGEQFCNVIPIWNLFSRNVMRETEYVERKNNKFWTQNEGRDRSVPQPFIGILSKYGQACNWHLLDEESHPYVAPTPFRSIQFPADGFIKDMKLRIFQIAQIHPSPSASSFLKISVHHTVPYVRALYIYFRKYTQFQNSIFSSEKSDIFYV